MKGLLQAGLAAESTPVKSTGTKIIIEECAVHVRLDCSKCLVTLQCLVPKCKF